MNKYFPNCTPKCAVAVPCPTCGSDLDPIGRDNILFNRAQCCENARNDVTLNTRHLWGAYELEPKEVPDEAPRRERK